MIIYTCPKCGSDLTLCVLHSNPPKEQYSCPNCNWTSVENIQVKTIRIPYNENQLQTNFDFIPSYCKNCLNHPKNGGSGICNCILGSLNQIIY